MRATTQVRISQGLAQAFLTAVQLLVALGSAIAVTSSMVIDGAGRYASACTVGDGASPTSQQTGNMPSASLTVHSNKAFMKWLAKASTEPSGRLINSLSVLQSRVQGMPQEQQEAVDHFLDNVWSLGGGQQ